MLEKQFDYGFFFARSSSIQFVISFGWYNQIEYNFKLLTKWLFLFQINLSNSFSVSYEIEYLISTNFSPVQWNLLFFYYQHSLWGAQAAVSQFLLTWHRLVRLEIPIRNIGEKKKFNIIEIHLNDGFKYSHSLISTNGKWFLEIGVLFWNSPTVYNII